MRIEGDASTATNGAASVQGSVSAPSSAKGGASATVQKGARGQDSLQLSPEAQREVEKLKETDRKVRAHEQAHMAAGAGLVRGGAQYSFQRGPDGQMYAVGGEVSLDTSPVPNDPRATMVKAQQVRAAALAPADPSPQDERVAAQAGAMAAEAASELARQKSPAGLQGSRSSQGGAAGRLLDITA